MEKSIADKEREVKDLIQRAKASPERKGQLRRDVLTRLIDLTHSPHPSLKILAAQNLRFFLTDFPQLEEAAINAIYDLCEDQSQKVRIQGYSVITEASRANSDWVKRNADVLVQLLQSDSPDEVIVVKRALTDHLELDAKVTLCVLCDQITTPEETLDEEEQAMRIRLQSLVLSFLTGEARQVITQQNALREDGVGETLINSLLTAIPHLSFNNVEVIVKELLLPLNAFRTDSAHSVMGILLDKVCSFLRVGIRSGDVASLHSAQSYLDLVGFAVVTKKAAPAIQLLRFYCNSIATKMTLQKFPKEQQSLLTCNIAETLSCFDAAAADITVLRRQIVDSCPFLLESLSISTESLPRIVNACTVLLRACVQRKEETQWLPPPNLICALSAIDNAVNNTGNIHDLIRSLVPPSNCSQIKDSSSSTPSHIPSNGLARTKPASSIASIPSSQVILQDCSFFTSSSKHELKAEPIRSNKRQKGGLKTEPALLKRLSSNVSPQQVVTSGAPAMQTDSELPRQAIGYSIKGAATAKANSSISSQPQVQVRKSTQSMSSLLQRLEGPESSGGRTSKKRGRAASQQD